MNHRTRVFLLSFCFLLGTCRLLAQQQPQQPEPFPPPDTQQQPPDQNPDQNNPDQNNPDQDNNNNYPFSGPPKPAGEALPYFDFGVFGGGANLRPDYTPLTSMLNAGLGFPEVKHSYWVPGISYGSTVQSNLFGSPNGNSGWYNTNYVTGDLSLLEAWSRSQLALNYSGGGSFSANDIEGGNSAFQQLSFAQSILLNRWIFQIVDQFSQLPESAFGFGIGTMIGVPGVSGSLAPIVPGVGNAYNPNQSIFSSYGPRISNVTVAEATYQLTHRSSITASGSYGLLHFTQSGNIDTNSVFGSLGYNYKLTKKDSIGVFYQISTFHFPGNPEAYGTQTISAAYARKITGRLALSLYGGPQFTSMRITTTGSTKLTNGYASASLNYSLHNGGLSAHYVHGISGGSGVFTGSVLDLAGASYSRRLTRVWQGSIHFGYAHNSTIGGSVTTTIPGSGNAPPTPTTTYVPSGNYSYNNFYAGVGVGRPIGRSVSLFISYSANFENNHPGCSTTGTTTTCPPSATTSGQFVNLNIRWHPRPFAFE
jgi:hypothetical protein